MLARAHPTRDCLADRTGSDDDDDVAHDDPFVMSTRQQPFGS
jgi:hypothetical protein